MVLRKVGTAGSTLDLKSERGWVVAASEVVLASGPGYLLKAGNQGLVADCAGGERRQARAGRPAEGRELGVPVVVKACIIAGYSYFGMVTEALTPAGGGFRMAGGFQG
jgi:hypothetical protein